MTDYPHGGLDRKDHDEIQARLALVRAARESARRRRGQRRAPTMRDLAEALGDEDGMGATSRIDDARQRRRGGFAVSSDRPPDADNG